MPFFKTGFLLFSIIILLAGLSGCQSIPRQQVAAHPAASLHDAGKWQRFDLVSDDIDEARTFYRSVFGWQFHQYTLNSMTYYRVTFNGEPVAVFAGFSRRPESYRRAVWLPYLSVASVQQAVDRVRQEQGQVIVDRAKAGQAGLESGGQYAVVSDPEGALFGLVAAGTSVTPALTPAVNHFVWTELWAEDLERMSAFYSGLADYRVENYNSVDDYEEIVLSHLGQPSASIIRIGRQTESSAWLPYVRVGNLQETLRRVAEANGEVLVMPSAEIRQGRVAVVKDTQGAAIGLFEWRQGEALEMAK